MQSYLNNLESEATRDLFIGFETRSGLALATFFDIFLNGRAETKEFFTHTTAVCFGDNIIPPLTK